MRSVVLVAVHLALALALTGIADAKVVTTCYAGTDQSSDAHFRMVLVHEVDRDAHEVHNHTWLSNAPHRVLDTRFVVSADGMSFDYFTRGARGHGSFEGSPWAWTGYHVETPGFGGAVISDVRFAGAAMTSAARFEHAGRVEWRASGEATAFDCRELDRRRAALDDAARDAARTCYEGTLTIGGDANRAVVEQIVEKRRIVYDISTPKLDNRVQLVIDGTTITASNGHAWRGVGTIEGTPAGGWTSYTYRARMDSGELITSGTIGGTRIRRVDARVNTGSAFSTLDAAAFDCKQLADRLATLTITP